MTNKANLFTTPAEERHSPQGKFHLLQKNLSLALGGKKDCGTWGGGFPFDVSEVQIPPGKANWPYHQHSAQWEFYLVLSGRGELRTDEGNVSITAGDYFQHAPGSAHQITNDGEENLVLLIVADNPPSDIISYPDTGQIFLKPQRVLLKPADELNYYDNEE